MAGFPMALIGYMDAEDVKAGFKKNPANKFGWPSGEKNLKVEGGDIPSSSSSWVSMVSSASSPISLLLVETSTRPSLSTWAATLLSLVL